MRRLFSAIWPRARHTSQTAPAGVPQITLPATDDMVFAIGDVHGCYDLYRQLEQKLADMAAQAGRRALVIILGDFIDRGPQSAQMLDHLIAPPPPHMTRIALMGNHEDMFVSFLRNPRPDHPWLDFGGLETLHSYGIGAGQNGLPQGRKLRQYLGANIAQDHMDFLANLPLAVHLPGLMFAHAGANGARAPRSQRRQDLLWGNGAGLDSAPLPVLVVHGHTPTPDSRPHVTPARVNIDTGAYASGILTALELNDLSNLRFIVAQAGQVS